MAGAIVVVTYNSAAEIGSCLDAALRHAPGWTVVVVDNHSSDQTLPHVKQRDGVRLIANDSNLGFAAAVNQGIGAVSDADPILLLNPDARLQSGISPLMVDCQEYGLATGNLVDATGKAQTGFHIRRFPTAATLVLECLGINRLWPGNPVNRRYRCLDHDPFHAGFVEQPAGAFLMFRREVWEKLGGLDERFHPIWFEDVDFCKRASDAGYRIFFRPGVIAEHDGGRSVGRIGSGIRVVIWYVSLLRYAAKFFTVVGFRAVCAAVALGSVPRAIVGIIQEKSLEPARAYAKVIWVSVRSLVGPAVPELSPAR